MPYIPSHFPTCLGTVIVTVALLVFLKQRLSRPPYPPGPKGLPIVGNIYDLPPSCEWITYAKWSRQFASDVIHLSLLGTHVLVVNSSDVAVELFDKRSAIYSDRPRMPMVAELSGWDWAFSVLRYGNKWRFHRRFFHQNLNSNSVMGNFEPQKTKATHELLYRLVNDPDNFMKYVRLMAGSLILSVTYGIDVQDIGHPLLIMVEKAMDALRLAGNPDAFLVNSLPLLKYVPEWFPGADFKRKANEWRKIIQATPIVPMQHVKDQMTNGIGVPSIASLSLERLEGINDREMEETINGVCGIMYAAGSDTTVSTLCTFFLAIVLYPDVIKKAQEELDRVVGQERLPDFTDKPFLPYIDALVKELLRWNPVTPLAIPHRLMVDDIYDGKFMPAGSIVMGNSWAILHDERIYPKPDVFNPERFLRDGKLDPDIKPPEASAFGFGRRACPGREFALSSMFIAIACILSTFDIEKAVDKYGTPITPSGEYSTGSLRHPMPFECFIKPRSPQALNLIIEAYAVHHPGVNPGSVSS